MSYPQNIRSLTVRLDEGLYADLVEQARVDGDRSISSLVRRVIANGLQTQDVRIREGGSTDRFEAARG